jgi:lipid A disaccharide synthetase
MEDWVETAGVVGLWEVLKMYGYFKRRLANETARILAHKPDAVILVDYPGFNLRWPALRPRRLCRQDSSTTSARRSGPGKRAA